MLDCGIEELSKNCIFFEVYSNVSMIESFDVH